MSTVHTCPCGCKRTLGFMQRRIATKAADLGLFFPMLDRLVECIQLNGTDTDQMKQFVFAGRRWYDEMVAAVHEGSTYGGPFPLPNQLYEWQRTATSVTCDLAAIDPEWYTEYWAGVFQSGYPIPAQLKRDLRAAGVVR